MTKRTKRSISQKVVGIGTSGMPAPVRKVLSNRIMAALVVVTVPVLFATGLLVVDWGNGIPTLSIDRHRASEAKAEATEKIKELSDNRDSGGFGKTPVKTFLTGGSDANSDGGWAFCGYIFP